MGKQEKEHDSTENIYQSSDADKRAEEEETNDSNKNRAGTLELKGCD